MVILGIDPGLAIVGYGVLKLEDKSFAVLDYGTIQTAAGTPMSERLTRVYDGMNELIHIFRPEQVAFEELFFHRNVTTAFSVGQARGVLLLAAAQKNLPLYEYTPMQVKLAVAGYGHAEKLQVQNMVKMQLKLKEIPRPDDAADALAVAMCHGNTAPPMREQFRIQ